MYIISSKENKNMKKDMSNEQLQVENLKQKGKRKKFRRYIFAVVLIVLIVYIVIGLCKTDLVITSYVYHSEKLPEEFDGFKIVLISDLHHKNFGKNQSELIDKIKAQSPDMIALTGDIVDEKHKDMESIEDFIAGIRDIAPAYYVSGNHEHDPGARYQYEQLKVLFEKYGIADLDYKTFKIERGGASIVLTGVSFCGKAITTKLKYADESKFNILLYHGSDVFDMISGYGYDIMLSGHAHGGVIRLPIVGGVLGNERDFFPKFDGGVYVENNCTMFSSKGLGDAEVPRFYNPPEIVVVTLKCN